MLKNLLKDAISVTIMGFLNKIIAESTKPETKNVVLFALYFAVDKFGGRFSKFMNMDYLRCNILERVIQSNMITYSVKGSSYVQGELGETIEAMDDMLEIQGDDFTVQATDDKEITTVLY